MTFTNWSGCRSCAKLGEECGSCERERKAYMQKKAHDNGEDCRQERCQACCPHDDRDHGMCINCGHEQDFGELIDRAMDSMEDR